MAFIPAIDVSQYQGDIDWPGVSEPITIIKMSGGDAGLYTDSKANQNYYGAKNAGKAVGMYHFAGGGNPENEADFFLAACSPLEQGDVMVLDFEIPHDDPVGWCRAFRDRIHDRSGVWVILYINLATLNAHDWSSVLDNSGLWVAAWNNDPEGNLPIAGPYVMHQYTSDGLVPGIAGRVDLDAWFGSLDQFRAYGYQPSGPAPDPAPVPTPTPPLPDPTPTPVPDPIPPDPTPTPDPLPSPTPPPAPNPTPTPVPDPLPRAGQGTLLTLVESFINWLKTVFHIK